ncbi:MAG: hypothetical protein KatS3mg038_2045 [Candidatus Kapaibacterium sp.]|nr:MAG: hypothetical protein KatS3mg038_2045 [Candidatus Kapabacteria bacterium]
MGSYKNRLYPRMTERPLRFRLNPHSPLYYGLVLAFLGEGSQEGCTHAIDSGPYQVPTRHYEGQPAIMVHDAFLGRHVLKVVGENMRTIRMAHDMTITYPWCVAQWAHLDNLALLPIAGLGGPGGSGQTYSLACNSTGIYIAGDIYFVGPFNVNVPTNKWFHASFNAVQLGFNEAWFDGAYAGAHSGNTGNFTIRYVHGREDRATTNNGYLADLMAWNNRILTTNEAAALADPGNVDLRVGGVPLILPPRRRSWPGITITTQDEVITLPTLLAEC